MTTKLYLATGRFFIAWWIVIAVLFFVTWPPTILVIIFWVFCGIITTLIFCYEDIKADYPLYLRDYINWGIWFISGGVSALVLISAGWYNYRQRREDWRGKSIR